MWWVSDVRLSAQARAAISDAGSDIWVSTATVWEICIKRSLGRLDWPEDVAQKVAENRFIPLLIDMDHAIAAGGLPPIHGDPFDRMIVAQAQIEGLTIVTRDPVFGRYDVTVLAA